MEGSYFHLDWIFVFIYCAETRPLCCPRTITSSLQGDKRSNQDSSYAPLLLVSFPRRLKGVFPSDRKKVLKHHPDKKAGQAGDSNDDAFFKCIQKAMEVLTNAERRRQFDSVDPYYELLESDVPTANQVTKAKDPKAYFFKGFAPVFEREARFSRKQPVPLLGTYDATKAEVEGFYDFWYNFDSWRSFEYLDKEVNEGSDK